MRFALYLLILSLSLSAFATELTIKIKNVKEGGNLIHVGVFDKEENWPAGPTFKELRVKAVVGETVFTIDLPSGEYGISVFQDLNGNDEMDYNAIRMPKEPWGASNDAPARFGPPRWSKMKIFVGNEPSEIEFQLRH